MHSKSFLTCIIILHQNYLPKMSIPVERRDLGDGWVLTCRGEDGGDLTLSDVKIQRENLVCRILGGDSLFFPMFSDDDLEIASTVSTASAPVRKIESDGEDSILDHIRVLLLQAQKYGCWKVGVGGVGQVSVPCHALCSSRFSCLTCILFLVQRNAAPF